MAIPLSLVRLKPANPPVVSVYADWRVSGRGRHEAPTVVEKHLREALAVLPVRGEAHASLSADATRILAYLAAQVSPAARGVVIFASRGRGLWFVQESVVPTDTLVHVGDSARLLPFAEMVQDSEECLVAIIDSEHLRLIDLSYADIRELEGLDENTWGGARISSRAAWRTANRQRAHEVALQRYADEVATVISEAMQDIAPHHLALAGGDEIVSLVRTRLPAVLHDRLVLAGHADRDIREEDVVEQIWTQVQSVAKQRRSQEIARFLAERECVAVFQPVLSLLETGRAGVLAFDPDYLSTDQGESLLRPALDQHVQVILARGNSQLTAFGGAVAWLR